MKFPHPNLASQLLPSFNWPEKIESHVLIDRVRPLHQRPMDFDEGDLIDRIEQHAVYRLEWVELERLDPDEWATDATQIASYAQMEGNMPPIVIDAYDSIIDGTHRVNAALLRGERKILAYVGQEND